MTTIDDVEVKGAGKWVGDEVKCVYIPVKEMLAHAPGFHSLYATRQIHFEEIYDDILVKAQVPMLLGQPDRARAKLLELLRKRMGGRVHTRKDEFFLNEARIGNLEFSLLAEGYRKLGLLYVLIQNGSLESGSVLFWDEPETNLNPSLLGTVVEVLLELQRQGVQVLLATHDYVLLKEFDLRRRPEDQVAFHALYRDEAGDVRLASTDDYLSIHPNAIADTFASLYERDMQRALRMEADA
jgi:hypothetical protein